MISPEVMQELLAVRQVLHYLPESQNTDKGWTPHEQQLFWVALTKYPQGPWTAIARYIGTKTTRQAMTHAQKLRQKLKRWNSRLRRNPIVSSLMDGVCVSEDGNVTASSKSEDPLNAERYGIPLSFPTTADGAVLSSTLRPGVGSTPATTPFPSDQVPYGYPAHFPAPFLFDRQHAQLPVATSERTDCQVLRTTISHEFVDEIAKSLWEDDREDHEVTEEELNELDDGKLDEWGTKVDLWLVERKTRQHVHAKLSFRSRK